MRGRMDVLDDIGNLSASSQKDEKEHKTHECN
jgi:hypothetical protein